MSAPEVFRAIIETMLADAAVTAGASEEKALELAAVILGEHATEVVAPPGFLAMLREIRERAAG